MISRRSVLIGAGVAIAGGSAGYLAWPGNDPDFQEAVKENRARIDKWPIGERALVLELVRHAVLAANSHNTQPWLFEATSGSIRIAPDVTRRCPVVDPEDRHVMASLGCATENLLIAATAAGLNANVRFEPTSRSAVVTLEKGRSNPTSAFKAIIERQSTRAPFERTALSSDDLKALESAAAKPNVRSRMLTARDELNRLKDFVVAGNTAQCNDAAFVRELGDWIRFNQTHAAETQDGLYSGSSGNPPVPRWLGRHVFPLFFTAEAENSKYVAQVDGSAGAMILYAEEDQPYGWFNVGRASQRVQLEATVRDIRTSFINQPVEVGAVRSEFSRWLGDGLRPALVIRFGRGKTLPQSLRRPASAVLKMI